jgi:hypothetical protein
MLSTYRAVLRGRVLEWQYDQPLNLPSDRPVTVHVTILDDVVTDSPAQQGQQMATALEQLAHLPSTLGAVDAAQWEREIRQERSLPGREQDADRQ